jgi:hypothetical protein
MDVLDRGGVRTLNVIAHCTLDITRELTTQEIIAYFVFHRCFESLVVLTEILPKERLGRSALVRRRILYIVKSKINEAKLQNKSYE